MREGRWFTMVTPVEEVRWFGVEEGTMDFLEEVPAKCWDFAVD
jgi:hypothetical protein